MTRTMVLGILKSSGPMSGYEIQQMMESSQTDEWAYIKPASIYHALKKLQEEGKVVLEKVEKTGLRTKSIFNITEDGELELRQLLIQSFSRSSVVFPAHLYTALTFMRDLEQDEIIASLHKQKEAITEIYHNMKNGYEQKKQVLNSIPPEVGLIFENMYDQCELQLQFIDTLSKFLEEEV
ncbi:PadR family transcriptional regulator [Bacillus sp. FSL W7-1360]